MQNRNMIKTVTANKIPFFFFINPFYTPFFPHRKGTVFLSGSRRTRCSVSDYILFTVFFCNCCFLLSLHQATANCPKKALLCGYSPHCSALSLHFILLLFLLQLRLHLLTPALPVLLHLQTHLQTLHLLHLQLQFPQCHILPALLRPHHPDL